MSRLSHFTRRLASGYLAAAAIALLIAIGAIQAIASISESRQVLEHSYAEDLTESQRIDALLEREFALARAYLLTGDEAAAQELDRQVAVIGDRIRQLRAVSQSDERAVELLDELARRQEEHGASFGRLARRRAQGADQAEVVAEFQRELMPRSRQLRETAGRLNAHFQASADRALADSEAAVGRAVRRVALISGMGLLLAGALALGLTRALSRLWQQESTAREEAEGARARYADLVEGLGGVLVWEADPARMRFAYMSPSAGEILGPEVDALKGRVPEPWRTSLLEALARAARGHGPQRLDHPVEARDGRRLFFHTAVHLAQGPAGGVLRGLSVDVSALRQAEQELRRFSERQAAAAVLGQRALQGGSPRELAALAARVVRATLGADRAEVAEFAPDGSLQIVAAEGEGPAEGSLEVKPGGQLDLLLRSKASVTSPDLSAERRFTPARHLSGNGLVSSAHVPMRGPNASFGLLGVASRQAGRHGPEDVALLESAANILSMVHERRLAEEALHLTEQRYRLLVEGVEDAIAMLDPTGRVLSWNPGAERMLGYAASEVVGNHYGLLFLEAERRAGVPQRLLQDASRHGRVAGEGWRARADGSRLWAEGDLTALRGEDGRLLGFAQLLRDVTERKRAEGIQRVMVAAGEALSQSLDFDRTLDVVARLGLARFAEGCAALVTASGQEVVSVASNVPALERALGRALGADRGERPLPLGMEDVLRTGEVSFGEDASLDPERPVSHISVPLTARSRTLGVIAFARAEEPYQSRDVVVALELARRAAMALDNALLYRSSQEAIRARDEFLGIASHELRTPLTSLQLQVQRLRRATASESVQPRDVASRLEVIERQTRRLARLVEGLLDISNITAGNLQLELERVDATEVARAAAARLELELRRAGCALNLRLEGPAVGLWDRTRLDQVVGSLLSNALKYGSGRPIDLSVEAEEGVARISVRDRGIGIAPRDQARIFERFERAVSERHYGGFGLGLWSVRQMVRALGGEVSVRAEPGKGSTFTVTLPLDGRKAVLLRPQAAGGPAPSSPH